MGLVKKSRHSGGIPEVSTRLSLSMEMSRLTRDETANMFSCLADHEQDGNHDRLIQTLPKVLINST